MEPFYKTTYEKVSEPFSYLKGSNPDDEKVFEVMRRMLFALPRRFRLMTTLEGLDDFKTSYELTNGLKQKISSKMRTLQQDSKTKVLVEYMRICRDGSYMTVDEAFFDFIAVSGLKDFEDIFELPLHYLYNFLDLPEIKPHLPTYRFFCIVALAYETIKHMQVSSQELTISENSFGLSELLMYHGYNMEQTFFEEELKNIHEYVYLLACIHPQKDFKGLERIAALKGFMNSDILNFTRFPSFCMRIISHQFSSQDVQVAYAFHVTHKDLLYSKSNDFLKSIPVIGIISMHTEYEEKAHKLIEFIQNYMKVIQKVKFAVGDKESPKAMLNGLVFMSALRIESEMNYWILNEKIGKCPEEELDPLIRDQTSRFLCYFYFIANFIKSEWFNLQSETLLKANYMAIFNYARDISELSKHGALLACEALMFCIKTIQTESILAMMWENFFFLLITLDRIYHFEDILNPYINKMVDMCRDVKQPINFKSQFYFLFLINCNSFELTKQTNSINITTFADDKTELVPLIIQMIEVAEYKSVWQKYILIQFIQELIKDPAVEMAVRTCNNATLTFGRFISKEIMNYKSSREDLAFINDSRYVYWSTLFEIIGILYIPVLEYYIECETKNYDCFESLLKHLEPSSKTDISNHVSADNLGKYLLTQHFKSLIEGKGKMKDEKYKIRCLESTEVRLENTELNQIKSYMLYNFKINENAPDSIEGCIRLLCENISLDELTQHMIDKFSTFGYFTHEIAAFIIKENIIRPKSYEEAKKLIVKYFNLSLEVREVGKCLVLTSLIKLLIKAVDEYVLNTGCAFDGSAKYASFVQKARGEDLNKFRKTHLHVYCEVYQATRLWREILHAIDITRLINLLSSFNYNKTCINMIEYVINDYMWANQIYSIERLINYDKDRTKTVKSLLQTYYQCLVKIEGNDFVLNNYFTKTKILDLLELKKSKLVPVPFEELSRSLFIDLDWNYVKRNIDKVDDLELPQFKLFEKNVIRILWEMKKLTTSIGECTSTNRIKLRNKIWKYGVHNMVGDVINEASYVSQLRVYYELMCMFYSRWGRSESEVAQKENLAEIEEAYKKLNNEKLKSNSPNNILLLKVRRVLASIFSTNDDNANIINIMKILKNSPTELKPYFESFWKHCNENNFNQVYVLMKYSLFLNRNDIFSLYLPKLEELSKSDDVSNDDKYRTLILKIKEARGSFKIIDYLKKEIDMKMNLLDKSSIPETKKFFQYCLLMIETIQPDLIKPDHYRDENAQGFLFKLGALAKICLHTDSVNVFIKAIHLVLSVADELNRMSIKEKKLRPPLKKALTPIYEILPWKIHHIIPQLVSYSDDADHVLNDLGAKLISNYAKENFELSAFLITTLCDKSTAAFGQKIKENLPEKREQLKMYEEFQSLLGEFSKSVQEEVKENAKLDKKNKYRYTEKPREIIRRINNFFLQNNKIMVPTHRNFKKMQVDLGITNPTRKSTYVATQNMITQTYKCSQVEYLVGIEEKYYPYMNSKDHPVRIKFITHNNNVKSFLLKDNRDVIRELASFQVLEAVEEIIKAEQLDKYDNITLRQYNFVPIRWDILLIEYMENVTTVLDKLEDEYKLLGVKDYHKYFRENNDVQTFKEISASSNVLWRSMHREQSDPNKWFAARKNFISSTAVWSMICLLMSLGDRHFANIMMDNNGNVTHIDFGYVIGTAKRLGTPEIVDFRFTSNIRKSLGLFEENGKFLQLSEKIFGAFVKNFSKVKDRLNIFATKLIFHEKEIPLIKAELDRLAEIFKKENVTMEFINKLCDKCRDEAALILMFEGWTSWY